MTASLRSPNAARVALRSAAAAILLGRGQRRGAGRAELLRFGGDVLARRPARRRSCRRRASVPIFRYASSRGAGTSAACSGAATATRANSTRAMVITSGHAASSRAGVVYIDRSRPWRQTQPEGQALRQPAVCACGRLGHRTRETRHAGLRKARGVLPGPAVRPRRRGAARRASSSTTRRTWSRMASASA